MEDEPLGLGTEPAGGKQPSFAHRHRGQGPDGLTGRAATTTAEDGRGDVIAGKLHRPGHMAAYVRTTANNQLWRDSDVNTG